VLFNPASVADRATYEDPRVPPVGITRVWVNGHPVVVGGALAHDIPPAEVPSSGV